MHILVGKRNARRYCLLAHHLFNQAPLDPFEAINFLKVVVVLTGIWTYSFLTGNGVSAFCVLVPC